MASRPGHYSLVREDEDAGEEYEDNVNVYEYDAEQRLFKRYRPLLEPLTPTKPRHEKIELEPEKPFVDGCLYGNQTAPTLSSEATNTA